MEEQTVITALGEMVGALGALSLVALGPDDPMALPEPPGAADVAAYERHVATVKSQLDPSYHATLSMSLRDYQAGYADRAGAYLLECLTSVCAMPNYTQRFSPEAQKQMQFYLAELREL